MEGISYKVVVGQLVSVIGLWLRQDTIDESRNQNENRNPNRLTQPGL